MPHEQVNERLWSWAPDADGKTIEQAMRSADLPIVAGHVALMPDAHFGYGATVGSVIPTEGAIIPSAVGVDIGCGMIAAHTDLVARDLPDSLDPLVRDFAEAIPAGVGKAHAVHRRGRDAERRSTAADTWLAEHQPRTSLSGKQAATAFGQFGTLGSGNHFVEVCTDESGSVWLLLHSGSRGIGNQLATHHIDTAKSVARRAELALTDIDLAYFLEGTPEFDHYVADLLWAQDYAAANREAMLDAALRVLFERVRKAKGPKGHVLDRVNCHHNYAAREVHGGREIWVTRKGAVRAGVGDKALIPGSMGTASYVVRGLGNEDSFCSCSHGAGRRMSRGAARRSLTASSLAKAMEGRAWLSDQAQNLVDEHPEAYKDIDEVMAHQADLVEVEHRLTQVANYKGT